MNRKIEAVLFVSGQGTDNEATVMEIFCSQCNAPMTCEPEHGCWCADFPHVLPVPDDPKNGCLCRRCLTKRLELYVIPPEFEDKGRAKN
jgi:hypothetical protein